MLKGKMWVTVLVLGMVFQNGYAENNFLSPLQETQTCLSNHLCAAANTEAAKAADQQALAAVAGNVQSKQALYDIAADIMPILEQQAGGDPLKMQGIILKAQTDPASFLSSLPPAIQAKFKSVAEAVEKSQGAGLQP